MNAEQFNQYKETLTVNVYDMFTTVDDSEGDILMFETTSQKYIYNDCLDFEFTNEQKIYLEELIEKAIEKEENELSKCFTGDDYNTFTNAIYR